VFLATKNLRTTRPNKKLSKKYSRLFEILERIRKLVYRLKLPPKMKLLYPVFYILLLEPYTGRLVEDLSTADIDFKGEEIYKPKVILDSRIKKGITEYLVK